MGIIRDVIVGLFPVFVGIGAYFKFAPMPYILVAGVIAFIVLIALDKIPQSRYAPYLYVMSLSLMWQATMFSVHIVGSDIHGEYYVSEVVKTVGWNPALSYGTQSSTSWVVGWLVPTLSSVLSLDTAWIYKAILPALFACVPVILYFAYSKVFSAKVALYGAIFFMIVPTTTLEIMQIGKSMVAELFLAGFVLLTVIKLRWYIQVPLLILCLVGALLSHYTVGIATLVYGVGLVIGRIVTLPIKAWVLEKRNLALIGLIFAVALSGFIGYRYYAVASEGVILRVMRSVVPSYAGIIQEQATSLVSSAPTDIPSAPSQSSTPSPSVSVESQSYVDTVKANNEVLVVTALGLDFPEAILQGKAFRIIQYLTQVLLVIGGIYLILRYKQYHLTAEYAIGIGCSFILLACTLFISEFSMIINATRFYHLALFFIAPLLVLTIMKWRAVAPVILIGYFAFTSGLVFEATKISDISTVQTPYAVSFSAERTGVVATYTADDLKVAKWLVEQSDMQTPIVSDYNTWHLLIDYIGLPFMRQQRSLYAPRFDRIPANSLIFVSSWNAKHDRYIDSLENVRGGAGLRGSYVLPPLPYQEVFRSGDAVVYRN